MKYYHPTVGFLYSRSVPRLGIWLLLRAVLEISAIMRHLHYIVPCYLKFHADMSRSVLPINAIKNQPSC